MLNKVKVNQQLFEQNQRLLQHLNTSCLNKRQVKQLLSEILGYQLDDSNQFLLPFYSDYGRNIKLGKNISISCNVMMADRAGIKIGDNVEIGAGTSLLTVDGNRQGLIVIDSGVKIGGNVIVLPNVHIGAHAVISAGAIVAHDVQVEEKNYEEESPCKNYI
ncbi:sugar O-acetyltransferase [Limosilactobacillus sp. STM2_1]|uniref:Sugar O-acetyltransferase n=1 Tax=Limosilactobacillus rudii TaxID=2759755 RepID=A0A7W3YLQ3_9LACO|nr:sugar O-acetyltransferase [Limosilactobacillus rudii]MBB1078514.1 sugar O-acetyltransferase [Limosilactobacillus rudii]MBB1096644.1 sugar O-acetyltransferase [Limosilactobacillus rudii]MCD7134160.1 sugar O-acetyltransferase [Limosilactobacillus rudii]